MCFWPEASSILNLLVILLVCCLYKAKSENTAQPNTLLLLLLLPPFTAVRVDYFQCGSLICITNMRNLCALGTL